MGHITIMNKQIEKAKEIASNLKETIKIISNEQ